MGLIVEGPKTVFMRVEIGGDNIYCDFNEYGIEKFDANELKNVLVALDKNRKNIAATLRKNRTKDSNYYFKIGKGIIFEHTVCNFEDCEEIEMVKV